MKRNLPLIMGITAFLVIVTLTIGDVSIQAFI